MKNKKIKLGLIAGGISGVMAIQGCDAQTVNKTAVDNPNTDSIKLEERLKKLSQTEYTGELVMGAMCYDPAVPAYMDYICSHCGDTIKEKYENWDIYNINGIENIVNQIKENGYDVVLDKTEFCPRCSKKEIEHPELIFKIRFSSNADYHIVKANMANEYQCLRAFLLDKKTFSGEYGEEHSLHNNIMVIQKMTGLGKDLKIENSGK
jgi:DNA-directed RNA polymerase subunit RPC12/RpoP